MLLGLIPATSGSCSVLGVDSQRLDVATLARVGYVAEGSPLPPMRVRDLAAFQKSFYPRNWSDELFTALVHHFSIGPKQKTGDLSRGQRTGLALGLAMAPQPELLIMDDPSLGLDPVARRALLEAMLLCTRRAGNTIFFASHELAEVERIANHVAILDRSVLRVCTSMDRLRERVRIVTLTPVVNTLPALPGLLRTVQHRSEVVLTIANYDHAARAALEATGAQLAERAPTLEEAAVGYLGDRGSSVSLLERVKLEPETA